MRSDDRPEPARAQHDALAATYRAHDVSVHCGERGRDDKPHSMFVRNLVMMTPKCAIIGRPASTIRAGEECLVAEPLGRLGVPMLISVHSTGADVAGVDEDRCFSVKGLRTNEEGADQVECMPPEIGVARGVQMDLPYGAMHRDGLLTILDGDLAVVWQRRTAHCTVTTMR